MQEIKDIKYSDSNKITPIKDSREKIIKEMSFEHKEPVSITKNDEDTGVYNVWKEEKED